MRIPIQIPFSVVSIGNDKLFRSILQKTWGELARAFNGMLSFGDGTQTDNVSGFWYNGTTPGTPNTDFTVNHNLGRVPVGYLVFSKSAACDVYTGSVAATKMTLTLRATVAGVVVRIFVT